MRRQCVLMGKKTNFSDIIKLSLYLSFQNSVLPDSHRFGSGGQFRSGDYVENGRYIIAVEVKLSDLDQPPSSLYMNCHANKEYSVPSMLTKTFC